MIASAVVVMASLPSALLAQTIFSVEGPITGIDPVKRTITVGYTFPVEIPSTLKFTGPKGTGQTSALIPSITGANAFTALLDVNAPNRVRSILPSDLAVPETVLEYSGATLIAIGTTFTDANGKHHIADFADFQLAENVIVGNLDSADVATGTFVIDGTVCKMNRDERFRAEIVDGGNNAVPFELLPTEGIGDIFGCVGYMSDGILHVVTAQTGALVGPQGVTISRADGVIKSRNLTVRGEVRKLVPSQTVSIFNDVTNQLIGTVPVTPGALPGTGSYTVVFKALAVLPTRIRAVTSDGFRSVAPVNSK